MKLNRIITVCAAAAALILSLGSAVAQQDNGNGGNANANDNGGQRRQRFGGGGFGGGNFDPAQFQQRILDRLRTDMNFTNDSDWTAVEPLVQKVVETRMAARAGGFGGRGGRGGPGGGGFGPAYPERDALQKALEDNAPAGQIKDLMAKYKAAQKDKQAKFVAAQEELRKVLTVQQEAQLTIGGWLE